LPALLKVRPEKENSTVKSRLKVTENCPEQSQQTGHFEVFGYMKTVQRNPVDTKQGHLSGVGKIILEKGGGSQRSNMAGHFQLNAV